MKTHTSQFKNQIKEFGRELDSKITYTIDGVTTELGTEQLNSVTPHYQGAILKSVMKQLDIDSNVAIPIGTELNYQFGVKVNGAYEYINYGNYIVKDIEKQEDTNSWKITCYDKMLYTMKSYETPIVNNAPITFPITIKDYLEVICDYLDLDYEGSNFANYDKQILNELFLDNEGKSMDYTFRDVLDQIAEVSGGTICINKNDEVEVRYIQDVGETGNPFGSNITIAEGEEAELQYFDVEGNTTQENTPSPANPSELVSVGYENLMETSSTTNNISNWYYVDKATNIKITEDMVDKYISIAYDIDIESISTTGNVSSLIGYGTSTNVMTNEITSFTFPSTTVGKHHIAYFTKQLTNAMVGKYLIMRYLRFSTTSSVTSNVSNIIISVCNTPIIISYVPYGKYGIEVKTTGKNLFNKDSYQNLSTSYEYNIASYHIRAIQLEPNTNYTVSHNAPSTSSVVILINNIQQVNGTNYYDLRLANSTKTITTDSTGCLYIGVVITFTNEEYNNRINECNIQIEKGTQATTYEEYKSNTYLYTLDNPLRSIGDTKDLLYIKNGMLYVERKIKSVVLDGSENWYKWGTDTFYIAKLSSTRIALSNYYKYNSTATGAGQLNDGEFFIHDSINNNAVIFRNSNYTVVADFQTWLSTHNTEVQFVLDEPYTEKLGYVQTPSTYQGVTYINATGNMHITYLKKYEEIDEEYLKDINVNFGEKFGPVNTIVLSRGGNGDKITLSMPENLPDEDKIAIQITDNQIMNDNNRDTYMEGLLNRLYGLEYYINDFSSTGIGYLDLCDRYKVKVGDNSYKCIMLNNEVDVTQGLQEMIYTEMQEENEQEYKYMNSTDRGITQANIIAKKNEAEIVEYTQKLDDTNNRINAVETKQTETDRTINIISTNIDANGNITEVTTTTGFTFNAEGMTIADSQSSFSALHRNTGTYYKDGENIVGQYTKDGSKQKDLALFGVYYYGMDDIDDTPMFVAQLYHDENGEEAFGHFYNRGD